jgi:hypothetical protein
MRSFWKSLLASLASWRLSLNPARREILLKLVMVAAIFLCAGPEIAAAIELQILLEMLGATLFMTAFVAGAKLVFINLGEKLRSHVLPMAPVALMFIAYIDFWLASVAAGFTSVHALWTLLV